jgi:hypothetical protein
VIQSGDYVASCCKGCETDKSQREIGSLLEGDRISKECMKMTIVKTCYRSCSDHDGGADDADSDNMAWRCCRGGLSHGKTASKQARGVGRRRRTGSSL